MNDTTREQEKIPAPEEAANNNIDSLVGAPIESETEERSADDRRTVLEAERSPRPRTCAAARSASGRTRLSMP